MSLDADVRRLASVRPFSALPREALQLLAFSCPKRRLKAGETLFKRNDPADEAYFVLEGEIALYRGQETRQAAQGALIGEATLLTPTFRPTDANATQDTTLLVITAETFKRVLSEFPGSAVEIRNDITSRARKMIADLERIRVRSFGE